MEEIYSKKIVTTIILLALIALVFFLLKPILLSMIFGVLLAFMFYPVYKLFFKLTKRENISAFIVCIFFIILIVASLWFLTPIFVDQSIKIYMASQQMDYITPLKKMLPSLFLSDEFSVQIGSITHSFITKLTNSLMNSFSNIIFNLPTISLHLLIVFFTFFFVIRDKDKFISYLKSILPFSNEVERELFRASKDIATSVLYGQIMIGTIQGLIAGLGYFIFKVPNALILTLFTILAGILPIIGPFIIWVPVTISLFIAGNNVAAIGVIIFGIIASSIDNFLRPIVISKKARMHPAIAITGMIGGFLFFGVLISFLM